MNMKKVISLLAVGLMLSTSVAYADYSDTQNHWASSKIQEAIEKGIVEGIGNFGPDKNITRYEFAKMMNKALKVETSSNKTFTDLEKGSEKESEILKAVAKGYIAGYEDNTVRPDNALTRQEAATMVVAALGLQENSDLAKKYTDYNTIYDYAKGKVGAVSISGIMGGNPDNSFAPLGNLTKAEGLIIALNVQNQNVADTVISQNGTVLKDQTIQGNLIISEALGNGSATIDNVTVLGKTIIKGGGANSIHILNSKIGEIIAADPKGEVRIVLEGNTSVTNIQVENGVNLESATNFTGNVAKVEIGTATPNKQTLTINVEVKELIVPAATETKVLVQKAVETITIPAPIGNEKIAKAPTINIAKNVEVKNVVAESKVAITGEGKIGNLEAKSEGITTEIAPDKTVTDDTVKPPEVVKPENPSGGGGGGGGGGGTVNYDTTVTSGTIHLEDGQSIIGTVNRGIMTFDLTDKEGVITGITLASDNKNTYTVTKASSPSQGQKTGTWTCNTRDFESMSKFIQYAKDTMGFGGATNTENMPISVIEIFGGNGTYTVEGTVNGKTLTINISL